MVHSSEEEEEESSEEEEGEISPDLLELVREVLKKKKNKPAKKLERGKVAKLLGCDIEDPDQASCVDIVLQFLKENQVISYRDLLKKKTKEDELEEALDNADPKTIKFGTKSRIRTLYQLINTKLPLQPPTLGRCSGAGTHHMSKKLRALPPSQQVATDPEKHMQAFEAFYLSVMDVVTIVEDEYILRAFMIANGKNAYIANNDHLKTLVDEVAPGLAAKLDGQYHRTILNQDGVPERVAKIAKMNEILVNSDGTTLEDARSGNFAGAWNQNLMLKKYDVGARAQVPTHKSSGSIKKADIVLDIGGNATAKDGGFQDSLDFVSIMEWKNNFVDGADREGALYAFLIEEGINRKRFLVFSVAPAKVEVFGVYWKNDDDKMRRVKLAQYDSATKFFQDWLHAMVYFSCVSPGDIHTPATPVFDAAATESEMLTHNVFKVKIKESEGEDKWYVYKVYDYVNGRRIDKNERRWLNWELVQTYYPDPELVVDLPALKIFRYPFQDSGEGNSLLQHVPPSIKSFIAIGENLQRLHKSGWIWGDVRLANMLFVGEEAYMIDLDFARKLDDNAVYPPGYFTERLPRHPAAKAGAKMEQGHDVYSFWRCFQILCSTGEDCPGNTMDDILPPILGMKPEKYVRPDPNDIDELSVKTGYRDGDW